ncbi:hypothetical protein GQ44DRAFT_114186 [Phaeosphaeriaceae sp. PMI808]|nr:hypothetical protein GQ44DRAFT_307027 [Phaeosphaeriaceae sp. PMI808]KAH8727441.1 hypothetical protein GQ44DRAFT_114186 [Phaeosphaeriaceae sp. PMI808]
MEVTNFADHLRTRAINPQAKITFTWVYESQRNSALKAWPMSFAKSHANRTHYLLFVEHEELKEVTEKVHRMAYPDEKIDLALVKKEYIPAILKSHSPSVLKSMLRPLHFVKTTLKFIEHIQDPSLKLQVRLNVDDMLESTISKEDYGLNVLFGDNSDDEDGDDGKISLCLCSVVRGGEDVTGSVLYQAFACFRPVRYTSIQYHSNN